MWVCLLLVHATTTEPIWLKHGMEIDNILDWRMGYFYHRNIHGTYGISKKPEFTKAEPRASAIV